MLKFMFAAALFLASASVASAQTSRIRAEDRTYAYDAQLPGCDDVGVTGQIQSRFAERERAFWKSDLTMVSIDRAKQTHFRPNGTDLIPRRYCSARATLSNGRHRMLHYNLVEDAGTFGWHGSLFLGLVMFPTPPSYGLEWCVSGLERSWTYAPDCRMARP